MTDSSERCPCCGRPFERIFLSITEGDATIEGARTAEVQTLCHGPNLGSAGGPTLMHLGAIARVTYRGVLMRGDQPV